jgi:hypothetical protein
MSAHTDLADGLRELATWIEQHQDLPMPWYPDVHHFLLPGADDTPATIAAFAAALGTQVEIRPSGHVCTQRMFGPWQYRVVHVPTESMDAYHARVNPLHYDTQRVIVTS